MDFVEKAFFEKARKTAKSEENQRKRLVLIRIMSTSRLGEKDKNRTTHKRPAGKAGSHKEDQRTSRSGGKRQKPNHP